MATMVRFTMVTNRVFQEGARRVAFASDNLNTVNQHFGSCRAVVIYSVTGEGAHFQEEVRFPPAVEDGHEGKLEQRLRALIGCHQLYCVAIGGSALRKLRHQGCDPVMVQEGTSIKQLLNTVATPNRPIRPAVAAEIMRSWLAEEWEG